MKAAKNQSNIRNKAKRYSGKGKWWIATPIIFITTLTAHAVLIEFDDARPYGNIGAPAVSKSNLSNTGGVVFEVRFEPDEYTGDVVARAISKTGVLSHDITTVEGDVVDNPMGGLVEGDNALWRAHQELPTHGQRIIFTSGDEFRWDDLEPNFQNLLDLGGNTNNHGRDLVNWIRGDSTNEGQNPGDFRVRIKENHAGAEVHYPLGDFIHSAIQYVGPPSSLRSDPEYNAFLIANKNRTPVVYAGANDGMLHAFDAENGKELFAYIPEAVLRNLEHLSDQGYAQTYYVDGTPTIEDAYADFQACSGGSSCWRTILVGGLNSGGQSIYALDVTDPEPSTESAAKDDIFLWEFFDEHLGYSFSRPIIKKIIDGEVDGRPIEKWVAIFGSGIQSLEDVSAYLFVVNLVDGSLIQKLEIPNPSSVTNGLLSPTGYDRNFDGLVDYVYAGDTDGNLWKFDFTTIDDSGDFEATFFYIDDAGDGLPLIRVTGQDELGNATNLVIQTPPKVTTTNDGTVLVIFGTGRVFGEADTLKNFGDSLFGILDNAPSTGHGTYDPANPNDLPLLTQSFLTNFDGDVRTLNSPIAPSTDAVGWRTKFNDEERALTDLVLSDKRISFTTINTRSENNTNWLNGVNYLTGGVPPDQFLDINSDGTINNSDLESGSIPVSIDLGPGIVSGPRIANIYGGFDVHLVTNGLKRPASFVDPGLIGGHFDLDTFDSAGVYSCWAADNSSIGDVCHTHQYDDNWDVTGVNMLVSGGRALRADSQERKFATGILSSNHRGLLEAMQFETDTPGSGEAPYNDDSLDTEVYIQVINPFSVDTPSLAQARADKGIDDNVPADHATIFYECSTGDYAEFYRELPAPAFNNLPVEQRTCVVGDISILIINFSDINSLRATEPQCALKNRQGPILGDPAVGLNSPYRDGSIVVQVVRTSDDVVIYENTNYEHLVTNTLDKRILAEDGIDITIEATCGSDINETLRAYKDPEKFGGYPGFRDGDPDEGDGDGSGDGDGGGGVNQQNPNGKFFTRGTTASSSNISSTRVSWREVLE